MKIHFKELQIIVNISKNRKKSQVILVIVFLQMPFYKSITYLAWNSVELFFYIPLKIMFFNHIFKFWFSIFECQKNIFVIKFQEKFFLQTNAKILNIEH